MSIENMFNSFDYFFQKINDNKIVTILIIIIVTLYTSSNIDTLSDDTIDLFDNQIFKFVLFILISLISSKSPSIGITLAMAVLVTLQIITNLKIRSDTKFENFVPFDPTKIDLSRDTYLNNPLSMQNNLNLSQKKLNLKLESPDDHYKKMIKQGRVLLDDSNEINKELASRYDYREENISDITKRDGMVLIQSGLNRLQVSDQGEYNTNNKKKNKFVKYNKLVENYIHNPQIMSAFNELKSSFEKLQSITNNKGDFKRYIEQVYKNEIYLLELIYKNKKETLSDEKQNKINTIISQIKQLISQTQNEQKNNYLLSSIKDLVTHLTE
jgi:hypothetical protein